MDDQRAPGSAKAGADLPHAMAVHRSTSSIKKAGVWVGGEARATAHRLLLGGEQRGRGGDAAGQVVERRLAQYAAAARVVQYIVDELRVQSHSIA
jgi:hypothetical protein